MSGFSDEMAALALELLTEFGEAVTFTRYTQGAYDPSTASTAAPSTSNFTGYGAPVDYDQREIDGHIVQRSDVKLFVNAVATLPATGDQVALDSINYRIMSVRKYAISSNNVLYELQLRV